MAKATQQGKQQESVLKSLVLHAHHFPNRLDSIAQRVPLDLGASAGAHSLPEEREHLFHHHRCGEQGGGGDPLVFL